MKQIGIKQVLECLDKGMSRKEIAEHFNISMADCKRIFMHEKLKGRKAKKQLDFELVDDTDITDDNEISYAKDTATNDEVSKSTLKSEENIEVDTPVNEVKEYLVPTPSWNN